MNVESRPPAARAGSGALQTQSSLPALKRRRNTGGVQWHPSDVNHCRELHMSTLNSTVDALRLGDDARHGHTLARAFGMLRCWIARSRSRQLLAQLDDRMLKDIGLSRADAVIEGRKHFWQR